jgi:hypothetical protein
MPKEYTEFKYLQLVGVNLTMKENIKGKCFRFFIDVVENQIDSLNCPVFLFDGIGVRLAIRRSHLELGSFPSPSIGNTIG